MSKMNLREISIIIEKTFAWAIYWYFYHFLTLSINICRGTQMMLKIWVRVPNPKSELDFTTLILWFKITQSQLSIGGYSMRISVIFEKWFEIIYHFEFRSMKIDWFFDYLNAKRFTLSLKDCIILLFIFLTLYMMNF